MRKFLNELCTRFATLDVEIEMRDLLIQASAVLKAEAATHGHSHWDDKGTHGRNCPICIAQYEAGGWDMARKIDAFLETISESINKE